MVITKYLRVNCTLMWLIVPVVDDGSPTVTRAINWICNYTMNSTGAFNQCQALITVIGIVFIPPYIPHAHCVVFDGAQL